MIVEEEEEEGTGGAGTGADISTKECPNTPVDVTFVLDESGSIGAADYKLALEAIANTVKSIKVGPTDSVGL